MPEKGAESHHALAVAAFAVVLIAAGVILGVALTHLHVF